MNTRNVFCPQYNVCLDLAARANRDFSCQGCIHQETAVYDISPEEQAACRSLLMAVFAPEMGKSSLPRGWQECFLAREADADDLQVIPV
jgi:hypothetical protein